MTPSATYRDLLRVVGSAVDAWDPYDLLAGGAPADEFSDEIASLTTRVRVIRTPEDATREVAAVFAAAFGPELFTPQTCAEVGIELFTRLQEAGLLSITNA